MHINSFLFLFFYKEEFFLNKLFVTNKKNRQKSKETLTFRISWMWCNSYFPHVQNGSPTFGLFKQNQIKVFFKWCQVSQIHKCLHVFQWGVNWNFSCEKLFLEYMQQLSLLPVLNNKYIMKHWTPITTDNIFSLHISITYKFSSVFLRII